ncbi:hypothetical protein BgAZ_304730 [Babesia gibsoni]|uniref:Uncharacterized protein n=1 Tax=Babesia gibsoni TaxID=33632 RepID=A0AAD8LHU6_BABGI|nr:hypothetical protein BgAZ_304730 [Babesia gibsoni]
MPRFHICRYVKTCLLLIFLHKTILQNVDSAKVSDLTPRVISGNAIVPKLNRFYKTNSTIRSIREKANDLLNHCAEVPIATTLATSSLLLSSAVWTGAISPNELIRNRLPRSLTELYLPFTSVLLMPELNGVAIVNLISFYSLLRDAEINSGSDHLLKRVLMNLLTTTLISNALGTPPDFYKFSRAVTVTNALENPNKSVNFQGIITLKNWHLPLALLIADYLMTLRLEQAVEGSKATLAGVLTHILCNKI